MLGLFRPKHERAIVQYCIDLYQSLQEQGYDLGLEHCGSINVAASKDRMTSIERRVSAYRPTGVECHLISPREMEQIHPHINTEDVVGGVWIPKDACVDAGKVSEVLAFLAHQGGAKFVSGCGVKRVITASSTAPSTLLPDDSTKNVRVSGVETELGHISCEYFVNCGGIWGRELGKKSDPKVKVPLQACEHYYLGMPETSD